MENKMASKHTSSKVPLFLYSAAAVVAVIAVAFLINNIRIFNASVTQYVAQGYPKATVVKQLIPNQLLPGIFEPLAMYGGIAVLLFASGSIHKKLSLLLDKNTENVYSEVSAPAEEEIISSEEDTAEQNEDNIQ